MRSLFVALFFGCTLGSAATPAMATEERIDANKPFVVTFPRKEAKFVRLVIRRSSTSETCLDELEIYGPEGEENLALAKAGGVASASSSLSDRSDQLLHRVDQINDGLYGDRHAWVSVTTGREWVQIELPRVTEVAKLVFSRDRGGDRLDRVPLRFEVQLSLDGNEWETVKKVTTRQKWPRKPDRDPVPPPPRPLREFVLSADSTESEKFRYAVLAEEHAWLKIHGRADLAERLIGYHRVVDYPRHVGDDRLPLPPLSISPTLDGKLDDRSWSEASRGVVRVAWPHDFESGPLVEYRLLAGRRGDALFLAIHTDRLLSSHLADISSGDRLVGELTWTEEALMFNSVPVEGAHDESLSSFEVRLPLALFPDLKTSGIQVRLGIGGKHTVRGGRPIHLFPSSLSLAEQSPSVGGIFRVRLGLAPGAKPVRVEGNVAELADGFALAPGDSKTIVIPADGPIGPEYELRIHEDGQKPYSLELFRYDPLRKTLAQLEGLVERLQKKGVEVASVCRELAALQEQHAALMATETPQLSRERETLLEARRVKRQLFFRDPDLVPLKRILFVKRHAFEPSHNYSVILDAPFRPGGGVYVMEIPARGDRLVPEDGQLVRLFDSRGGIARNPMANFDTSKIYFAHRPSEEGYFHVMSMNADGGALGQITDGPFHDYWPCPLPDGGLAFISTRCRARFLCWRPQAAVLFRMNADGGDIRPLSFANLSEWGPSVLADGRIIWQRSEYIDKGADFSHTLWSIRPDGTHPELVFGNTIIQPNGYANGRQVPGTNEISCTLVSHFGDLNGPIALLDLDRGRFNPAAITSITPEVPRPGLWPKEECFRDPVPIARDYFLCSHAPRDRFGLYVIDRFGNREMLHIDAAIGSMCPTPFRRVPTPPRLETPLNPQLAAEGKGQFLVADVYEGIASRVPRGKVKYLRVVEEVRASLIELPNGEYQKDHEIFKDWYATPIHKVNGPFGWPSYVAKATHGIVPVEEDGSAYFQAPADKQLYFEILDEDFNELQRMRSVVQLQAGETRSCIGCHEDRRRAPRADKPIALRRKASALEPPPWGAGPFAYERVVQPVLDAKCVRCHGAEDRQNLDLTATLDEDKVPASYRSLIEQGWVHYVDCRYNSGGNEKIQPLTFGTVKSKLWEVLEKGHHDVRLTREEMRAIKCWIDLNCPLWPDYLFRPNRPGRVAIGRR